VLYFSGTKAANLLLMPNCVSIQRCYFLVQLQQHCLIG